MANPTKNNLKLGVFVSLGLMLLIISLYLIGKNKSMFGADFELRSRFSNTSGLRKGNNVLYAGIQAGTVKDINLVNDTTIEVIMRVDNGLKNFINKNAMVSIGTEGLMGNKVVQIQPNGSGEPVLMGDMLTSKPGVDIDQMLRVFSRTNQNIEGISQALKISVDEINQSAVLAVLKDEKTANNIKTSMLHINNAAANIEQLTKSIVEDTKNKKSTIGMLLRDTMLTHTIKTAATNVSTSTKHIDNITSKLQRLTWQIDSGANNNKTLIYLILKDTLFAKKLNTSMDNVQKGTDGFNQNMEALKNSFLFRGYFKKIEKEKLKNKAKQ